MDALLQQYPDVLAMLDDSEDFENTAELTTTSDGRTALLVTQVGPTTAGQALFAIENGTVALIGADAVVGPSQLRTEILRGACGARSAVDHTRVGTVMREQRDKFSSKDGPDEGNLACVWAVERIVEKALGVWISRQLGTQEFAAELKACFGSDSKPEDLPDGSIIISPTGSGTGKLRHGHVGLLGEVENGDRYIYSNSSRRARWERTHTIEQWKAYYGKHLDVLFFPLPTTGGTSLRATADERFSEDGVERSLVPLGRRWAEEFESERVTGIEFERLRAEYRRLYDSISILPDRLAKVDRLIDVAVRERDRYLDVSQATGVPWHVIAVIHRLEGSASFTTHLHNGDPLTGRTVQVPKGRPKTGNPPFTWEESAKDALSYDGFTGATDWSIERTAFRLEGFNGWGYRLYHPMVKSPYLWSFSTHYVKGKYAADGKWDPELVSQQCGTMVMIRRMYDRGILA